MANADRAWFERRGKTVFFFKTKPGGVNCWRTKFASVATSLHLLVSICGLHDKQQTKRTAVNTKKTMGGSGESWWYPRVYRICLFPPQICPSTTPDGLYVQLVNLLLACPYPPFNTWQRHTRRSHAHPSTRSHDVPHTSSRTHIQTDKRRACKIVGASPPETRSGIPTHLPHIQ